MQSEEEDYACAAIVVAAVLSRKMKPKRKRRKWVNNWLLQREEKGSYGGLFSDLSLKFEFFKQFLRIPLPTFQLLLEKIRPLIEKQDTHLRAAIPVGARLEATLLFLITGLPYARLQFHARISAASLGYIIPETCQALFSSLRNEYLKVSTLIVIIKI